jgi:phosphotransferase system enzyme I (PtsI)
MADQLTGLGVSPGASAGPALRMGRVPRLPAPRAFADPAAERAAAREALDQVGHELAERAARATDPAARAILEAQALMAKDPLLAQSCDSAIAAGLDCAHAVHSAFTEQADGLRAGGGYLAERAADLEDLRDRAVAWLLGELMPGIPDPGYPFVLIADDLAPADTATLDPARVVALVTVRGGPTSHTAILARALGLPAVVACRQALAIEDGTLIHVDGDTGTVTLDVPATHNITATHNIAADASLETAGGTARPAETFTGPGRTADGHRIPLLLNIGSADDLPADALTNAEGVEGVGLLRTELLFLGRHDAPSLDEQREAYARVLRALPGRRVVLRTLDAGADKPLPFLSLADEPNPALGIRGLRTARARPEVLDTQLEAVAQAARTADADVWVMAPMVSTAPEAAEFAKRVRAHGLSKVGAMIEVPAAALRAGQILEHVDFLSIGTNDLGQYTMAADRQCGELADLLDPWQPALLDLIALCARAGKEAGKPVGVCGEAASDPLLACVLVGLGISSLSMSRAAVARVGARLSRQTLDACARLAEAALSAGDAAAARAAVRVLAAGEA